MIQRVEPFGKNEGFLITLRRIGPKVEEDVTPPPAPGREEAPTEAVDVHAILNPMADRGASDVTRELPQPEPRSDDRPDWERD